MWWKFLISCPEWGTFTKASWETFKIHVGWKNILNIKFFIQNFFISWQISTWQISLCSGAHQDEVLTFQAISLIWVKSMWKTQHQQSLQQKWKRWENRKEFSISTWAKTEICNLTNFQISSLTFDRTRSEKMRKFFWKRFCTIDMRQANSFFFSVEAIWASHWNWGEFVKQNIDCWGIQSNFMFYDFRNLISLFIRLHWSFRRGLFWHHGKFGKIQKALKAWRHPAPRKKSIVCRKTSFTLVIDRKNRTFFFIKTASVALRHPLNQRNFMYFWWCCQVI